MTNLPRKLRRSRNGKFPGNLPSTTLFLRPDGRLLDRSDGLWRAEFGIYRVNFGSEWRAFTGCENPAEQAFIRVF